MATWPVSLGAPLLASNGASHNAKMIVTQMESGPTRRTLMSSHDMTSGSCSFVWTVAQMATWDTFFYTTIKRGTIVVADFPLDLVDGVIGHSVYLTGPSQVTLVPNSLWKVSMSFESEDRIAV